jgi:trk system potassium uptake protein TrkA
VIGLGRFGSRLAISLTRGGAEVIAVDRNPRLVEELRDEVTLAVRLDSTSDDALRAQGIPKVDAAIVAIGEDFESSALTVALLKELGVPVIYARAETLVQARILQKIGADAIINPESEAAARWAHRLMLPNLRQYVELSEGHSLIHTVAPATFHGKSPAELQLRAKYGVNLVAVQRASGNADSARRSVVYAPSANTRIEPGDVLVLVGSNENLAGLPSD